MTLGPKAQYAVLHNPLVAPTVTNDGVTIAEEIYLEDIFENQAAQLVKEVATKTNDVAGDGTTMALVLAQSIVREGVKIVYRALEEPMCQVAANAGADGYIVIDNVRNQSGSTGFNALTGEYEDLVAAGIIDPAMVTRSALQNAASVGSLVVTADVVVAEPPEGLGAARVRAGMDMDVL